MSESDQMTFTCFGQSNAYEMFYEWFLEIEAAELEYEVETWENEGGRNKN